mgnify:CR=1 FL=1
MPQYRWTPVDTDLAPEPESPYSWSRIGAGALRGLSGLLSGAVSMVPSPVTTPVGSAIAGAGEYGAQYLETPEGAEFDPNWKRIGVEAGLGAVPGGKLLKAGRALGSAARSGAFSGLGEILRQGSGERDWDPASIALQTGVGGAVGGVVGKMLGVGETAARVAPIPRPVPRPLQTPIQQTREIMRDQANLAKVETWLQEKREAAANAARIATAREELEAGDSRVSESYSALIPGGGRESLTIPYRQTETVLPTAPRTAPRAPRSPDLGLGGPQAPVSENPFVDAAVRASTRGAAVVPDVPVSPISQALEPFNPPRMAATPEVGDFLGLDPGSIARSKAAAEAQRRELEGFVPGLHITPTGQGVAADALDVVPERFAEDVPELTQLFKSPVDVVGQAYRTAKGTSDINPLAVRQLGASLQQEAVAAGLPVKRNWLPTNLQKFLQEEISPEISGASPVRTVPSAAPVAEYGTDVTTAADKLAGAAGARPMTADEVTEQLSFIDRIKRMGSDVSGQAAILPSIRLGTTLAGGLIGGATDPLDNPILSALVGAGLGAVAPNAVQAIRSIGVPESALQDPTLTMDKLRHIIPQTMRFNYLMSTKGLPANAFVGPYGSAAMGALEHGLAGDPRGWAAIQELNPVTFGKEAIRAWDEAASLIGRAEGESLTEASGPLGRLLAAPGTLMTGGDIAARKALMRAGFSENEARRMTLTSEPELTPFRRVAGFTKGSPELQTLMPFSRTPANIAEQGLLRTPGIGTFMQPYREAADPMAQQLVQQGLGAAVGIGSGVAGANMDPETAKWARRYITNAAGQYSLPAAVGFATGQAIRRGKPPIPGAINEMAYALPLPTVEPAFDLARWLNAPSMETAPNWAYPAAIREVIEQPEAFPYLPGLTAARATPPVATTVQPRYRWE